MRPAEKKSSKIGGSLKLYGASIKVGKKSKRGEREERKESWQSFLKATSDLCFMAAILSHRF